MTETSYLIAVGEEPMYHIFPHFDYFMSVKDRYIGQRVYEVMIDTQNKSGRLILCFNIPHTTLPAAVDQNNWKRNVSTGILSVARRLYTEFDYTKVEFTWTTIIDCSIKLSCKKYLIVKGIYLADWLIMSSSSTRNLAYFGTKNILTILTT